MRAGRGAAAARVPSIARSFALNCGTASLRREIDPALEALCKNEVSVKDHSFGFHGSPLKKVRRVETNHMCLFFAWIW